MYVGLVLCGWIDANVAARQDEGKFDPRAIPLKTWNDYENELWDKESNHSIGSWVPPGRQFKEGYAESRATSVYGHETFYEPRSQSPAPSQQFGMLPPAGYQSGRATPMSQLRPLSDMGALYPSQSIGSRPTTAYFDTPPMQSPHGEGTPNDADLERSVEDILRTADLNTVTKREIRRVLEDRFRMDLTPRKATINAAIDRVLLNHS